MSEIELKEAVATDGLPAPVIVMIALGGDQWLALAEMSGAILLRDPFDAQAPFGW
jgi:hypothetical protein